jgi:hypothetical protein
MNFIFEHEKLRLDEIVRKINTKNNFTPLKPLRSSNLATRNCRIKQKPQLSRPPKNRASTLSYDNYQSQKRSISPLMPKFFDSFTGNSTQLDFFKSKLRDYIATASENTPKLPTSERDIKHKALPIIRTNKISVRSRSKEDSDDNIRKNSQSLIAYIPTVTYVAEKEENKEGHKRTQASFLSSRLSFR